MVTHDAFESKSPDDLLRSRLRDLNERVRAACVRAGRGEREVLILLATKTVESERLRVAMSEGFVDFGENKVQELERKVPLFTRGQGVSPKWQMIGHLQSNKVKVVLPLVECIQSVDRLSLAQEIQRRLEERNATIDILIEVNTSGEESKSGVAPEGVLSLARAILAMDRIHMRGLMTLAIQSSDESAVQILHLPLPRVL